MTEQKNAHNDLEHFILSTPTAFKTLRGLSLIMTQLDDDKKSPMMEFETVEEALPVDHSIVFDRSPTICFCRNCNKSVTTTLHHAPGIATWLGFVGLLWWFWPLAWIPFLINEWKQAIHTCPLCASRLSEPIAPPLLALCASLGLIVAGLVAVLVALLEPLL